MEPKEIRAELILAEVRPVEIAKILRVEPTAIYRVIEGLSVSARIRNVVAAVLNLSVEDIWPDKKQAA